MLSITLTMLLVAAGPASPSSVSTVCEKSPLTSEALSPSTESTVRLAKAWLDAMNTLDDTAYISFIKSRGPVLLSDPKSWLDMRSALSGIRFCGVKSVNSSSVELWMFDPAVDSYTVANFRIGASPSDKIEFVFMRMTDEVPPGLGRSPKLAVPMLIKAVQARAASRAAGNNFSGAVLLAREGRVLFQKAYGFADRENQKPNTLDTQFRFGSMGKMFTAVAIMQLVQDGKINLEAPIGRYLTDYPNKDIAAKVTVANLLTHTGGTGDIFGPQFYAHKATLRSLKDYVDLYGTRPLEFAPASRMSYSNYGFILLGRIIEEVSGFSYDNYVQQNIFRVAGMTSTGNLPESTVIPHRSVAYMGSGPRLKRADEMLPLSGTSAGGGYSTVGDFNKFVNGLTSHKLLRSNTLQKLIHGGIKTQAGQFVPFDFTGTVEGTGRYIGHNGGAPGMSGVLYHFLASNFTVIVLANRDPGAAESVAMFAAHRLPVD